MLKNLYTQGYYKINRHFNQSITDTVYPKYLHGLLVLSLNVYKLPMFYVWAFCHTTDINTIMHFVPNTPEHVLVNTRNSCCDALPWIVNTYSTSAP
jgi:hypothetical protein